MIEILRKRRSIRKYQATAIDSQAMEVIKEALLRSPSSRGTNPWTFIFVDQKELLGQLSRAKEQGAQFVKDAALAVVVCGDETQSDVWVEDCSIAAIVAQLAAQSLGLGSCWSQIRERAHSKEKSGATRLHKDTVQQVLDGPFIPPAEEIRRQRGSGVFPNTSRS